MADEPSVSLIVLNWNGRGHLEACLNSLARIAYPADRLQVILCDNGSSDGSVEYVRESFPTVTLVELPENLGFAGGNNRAVETATGEWIGFLNNDMVVEPGWLGDMIRPLTDQPELACISSRIVNWDGSEIDFIGGGVNFQGHGFQLDHGSVRSPRDLPRRLLFACGGGMLVRRDVFDEVGGFDADYFAYFEDVDLGWRLNLLGHDVWYTPEPKVFHRHHGTSGKIPAYKLRLLYERNALFTIYKCFDDANLAAALPAAMLLLNEKALRIAGVDPSRFSIHGPAAADETEPPGSIWTMVRPTDERAFAKVVRLIREEGVGGMLRKAARKVLWRFMLLRLRVRSFIDRGRALPSISVSHYAALSEFAHGLEKLKVKRAWLQAHRVRSDAELLPLFHNALDPSYNDQHYIRFHRWLCAVLELDERFAAGEQ